MVVSSLRGRLRPYNRVRTPSILQHAETECGISAMAMIFAYYGHHPGLPALRDACGSARDGSQALTLIRVARQHGFQAKAFQLDISSLHCLQDPVIVFWQNNHYVVLEGFGHDKVFINDPGIGQRQLSFEEFATGYSGVAIQLTPNPSLRRSPRQPSFLRTRLTLLKAHARTTVYLSLSILITLLLPLLIALSNAFLINLTSMTHDYVVFTLFISTLTLIVIMVAFIKIRELKTLFQYTCLLSVNYSRALLHHLLRMPMLYYSIRQKSALAMLLSHAEVTMRQFVQSSSQMITQGLLCLFTLSGMFYLDNMLAVISLALTILLIGISMVIYRLGFPLELSALNHQQKLSSLIVSTMRQCETIQATGTQSYHLQQISTEHQKKLHSQVRQQRLQSFLNGFQFVMSMSLQLVVTLLGYRHLNSGQLSMGGLIAYIASQSLFVSSFSSLQSQLQQWQAAILMQLRQDDCFATAQEPQFQSHQIAKHDNGAPILATKQFSFAISPHAKPILKHINIAVRAGQHIGIVGATGSGKSTLVQCLCGLFKAQSEQIYYQGQAISTFSLKQLSTIFAYVSQEIMLIEGSLYDNLTLGCHDPKPKPILEACRLACIDQLVQTRGLGLHIDQSGSMLSGGEKQRIELARALLQNTPILILDEATAALDDHTQQSIIDNLKTCKQTILFVAHRLQSIQHCDQIWVMHEGEIVAQGKHSELLIQSSQYAQLWQKEVL